MASVKGLVWVILHAAVSGFAAQPCQTTAAMVQAHMLGPQEERAKGKARSQKRVHDNEQVEQGVGGNLPAGQESGCQTPVRVAADGGPSKRSRLTESGRSGQAAGIQARVRAEVEKSGASSYEMIAE